MYGFVVISFLISIPWCYSFAKKNNFHVPLWTILGIFTGPIAIILLLIRGIIHKKASLKECVLLAITTLFCIIAFIYYRPIHIEQTYCGDLLSGETIINDNVSVSIKAELYRTRNGLRKVNGIMELDNYKYTLYFLLSEDNGYTFVLTDHNCVLGKNKLHISKDYKFINIQFENLNSKYNNYTIKAKLNNIIN